MHSIFFLIPLLAFSFSLVYAEQGINYDTEIIGTNPDGSQIIQWTSHPDRILNNDELVNYVFTDTNDYLRFESASISFELDKSQCDFKLYDAGLISGEPVIESYSNTVTINGEPIPSPVCIVQNIIETEDGVSFDVRRGAATVLYELHYSFGVEWTYDIVGNGVIGITEVCTNCTGELKESLDTQRITFGAYTLDTKNNIHGAFKEASQIGGDYQVKYEANSDGRLIIDPSITPTSSHDVTVYDDTNNDVCGTGTSMLEQSHVYVTTQILGGATDCTFAFVVFDITSLPSFAQISDTVLTFDTTSGTSGTPPNCDYVSPGNISFATSASDTFAAILTPSAVFVTNNSECSTAGINKSVDLGSTADSTLQSQISFGNFTLGIKPASITLDGTLRQTGIKTGSATPEPTLTVTYTAHQPDAVDDLTSTDIGFITVDLAWTEPNLQTGNLTGYQINYTTPWSDNPNTIITNNTQSSDVTSEVTGLSELTQYSFRIGVWTEGFNADGNVLNITTLEDFISANFTPGFFDLNATNPDVIQMYFDRTDINSTALFLNVTYPTAYDLSCDFSYEFANINQTYSSLIRVATTQSGIDSAVQSSFQFNNVDNEIIDVYCWDENNLNNDGQYVITQTVFPLLQQIADFRSGEFGTMGAFGAMDLITMFVIIISMIGFNRVNESVGAIFNIILLGSLAYFEIIELPTIIFGMIAVVIMVVIGTTKKK